VTGFSGQPNYDNAHICSVGDTVRIEFGTPGIACNPNAILTLNELRILVFQGFIAEEVLVSGGIGGPFSTSDYTVSSNGAGTISVDLNPGSTIQMDQNNPVIFDIILSPDCSVIDESLAIPLYELDYSLPGNIPSQITGSGLIDLRSSIFEPFINIISSNTTPEVALPGDIVCRDVILVNNGQFSLLDTMFFKDLPDFGFSNVVSFDIFPIESGTVSTTAINGMPYLNSTTGVDSIEILLDGTTFGGPNGMFEVDGGVQLVYCVETQCPATVNNSMLSAWYGCNDEVCQESTDLESVVVVFNGIPDLLVERSAIILDDPCVDPLMWEFRIVNDSINGGALETLPGEADAQDIKATIYRNDCEIFLWDEYFISIGNVDGSVDDHTAGTNIQLLGDSICFTGLPDLGVNDTLIIKINLSAPADDGAPLECEELVSQDEPSCLDPWLKVTYEDRCDDPRTEEQAQPVSSSFPPTEGNPMMSFSEVSYVEPSYCAPGKITFEMNNISGLDNPTTTAKDLQFYIRKQFCSTFDLINYEYGTDASTGNTTGLVVDDTGLDSFYVVSVPGDIAKDEALFFSFEIELGCKDSNACVHPDAECFMPDVKATWENCYDLRWFTDYEFGYKLIDYKPEPQNGLENFGGGAGPTSFLGSGCSYRNYWYRYQFGGINYDDCRVFLRYKVAQINADGTAGSVMTAADMAAGVASDTGTTTHSIIAGVGGAPDTLVIEVESSFIESCIEEEEILINVQHASICTSAVEPVKFYESYEVIFECDNGTECCSFKRSCYETAKDCYCGTPGSTPICYLFCLENTSADLCRITNGCPAPDASYSNSPDPKDHALPCDTMRLNTTAQFVRQSSSPANPPCDEIAMMFAEINPGPHLEYCEGTASFTVSNGTTLTSSCAPIPYDPLSGEFDLTTCVDWSQVMDGWSIDFQADWKVKEDVPACADGFMMEEIEVEFKGKFVDGGNITNCGSPKTQKAPYFVGDPFKASMQASLEFNNGCEVSAAITMFDDCGVGNKFNDYRPGYILDSIVYNISGAEFTYTPNSAVLKRKGLNGPETYDISASQITTDNANGFSITFENDGTWPEELTRTSATDSLFCLFFDLEFTECYAYSTNITADSKIYYNSCGGCGPREIESPGGIEFNNPPEAILNCLGAPIVQTPDDEVVWNIQVGHPPTADFHWVAFDLPPSITFDQVYDNTTGTDITSSGITNGSVTWFQLGSEVINDLTLDATYTECDTVYVPVYVGWSCNGYPDNPVTGEFANGESCNVIQKELAVVRAMTGLQAAFINQITPPVDLCGEIPFEVVIKNVGIASHFMQEFCFYLPKEGMEVIPESVCFAHPDTIVSLGSPGAYMDIDDAFVSVANPDTIINGQPSKKYVVDMSAFASILGADLELPGATFPENNENKYLFKWKAITNCDYISGSKLYAEAFSSDACGAALYSSAESSDIVPITGLDPRDFNKKQVVLLDTLLGACIDNQIITANIVSFPNPIGANEFVCITIPSEATVNGYTPFNPVNWTMTPIITPVSGGDEYCWQIPEGTPPGVLAFNLDLTVDPTTECGMLNFASLTKVSKESVCITTGESCDLEIFTSELETSAILVIPAVKVISSAISGTASCNDSGAITMTTDIAVQNQGAAIPAGANVAMTIFSDANGNATYDVGEELATDNYAGGLSASQIVFLETTFDTDLDEMCNLMVVVGAMDCACTSAAEMLDPDQIEIDICTDLPLVCEGGQASLLCESLPTSGYTLEWSSENDPDFDYLDESTGVFGPAASGIYTYGVTMNLGNGCKFSGNCTMQVIGELGNFTISGEPSCAGEESKCTIEMEPLCKKEILNSVKAAIDCDLVGSSLEADRSTTYNITSNGSSVSIPGPGSFTAMEDWTNAFNDSIAMNLTDLAQNLCVINEFGIEQSILALPKLTEDNLAFSDGGCELIPPCLRLFVPRKLSDDGSVDVSFDTPCGGESMTFTYTSYVDLETQVQAWFDTTVNAALGGMYTVGVSSSGIILTAATGITCTDDGSYSLKTDQQSNIIQDLYVKNCTVECQSGSYQLEWGYYDLNGNEIEAPQEFCCSQENISFSYRPASIFCNRAILGTQRQITLLFSPEMDIPNPLNNILLYSWSVEGGDVISQEGNCANLRWNEVGIYEVCATPLLSPDSGLDCGIPPVCKDHLVIEDDLGASVSVDIAETCNEVSSVDIIFDNPDDIGMVSICDEAGEVVYMDAMMGCTGMCSNLLLYDLDCLSNGGTCDPISATLIKGNTLDVHYQVDMSTPFALSYNPDGSIDATGFPTSYVNDCDFGIEGFADQQYDLTTDGPFEDWIKQGLLANAANAFYNGDDCAPYPTSTGYSECNGFLCTDFVIENGFFVLAMDGTFFDDGSELKNLGIIFIPTNSSIDEEISEVFGPGSYTMKVEGATCGDTAEYPFELPEPPSDEVLLISNCNDASACDTADGSLDISGSTNGVIDSIVICNAAGNLESIDYSLLVPPLYAVDTMITGLPVGTYTTKIYTECGEEELSCNINSSADVLNVSDLAIKSYTNCAADDAEISLTVNSSNPIDSIIWCGPMGATVSDLGPHASPYSATTGSGIIWGDWTAKIYTACGNIQEVFNVPTPPPGASVTVSCDGIAPASCLESFGSLDIDVSTIPGGFTPDSIVLSNGAGFSLVDMSGALSVSFSPLVPGTYDVMVYMWDACNLQAVQCVVPEPENELNLTMDPIADLPCEKLAPDSLTTATINYSVVPSSLPIVRVDWYKGTSVSNGLLVSTNISPDPSSDTYDIPAGADGDYCVVVIAGDAGLFSSCPRDTICFTVASTECPADCDLVIDTFDLVQQVDCVAGSLFDFNISYAASGCVVEDGLESGAGFIRVELLDVSTGIFKGLNSTQEPSDTLSCTDVNPGDYEVVVSYIEGGETYCSEILPLTLINAATLDYTIELNVMPTPCDEEVGEISVSSITDNLGNSYPLTDFDYLLLNGFTPVASINSPNAPVFTVLTTGLYTVEIIDVSSGCVVGAVGAIIPNDDSETICPSTILPSNNCGPCDGMVIMPDSLGIIYRMQDAMGNLIFPQDAPNEHIFVDVCAGMYEIIAFDLSLDDPSECPSICEVEVPISEDGFQLKLDTISGSPCELNDGRILMMAVNGNCSYEYELYDLGGQLISDTPVPDPSANVCGDKSDMMIFLGLTPGDYKVVGFATDSEGNENACMYMDTITLRDNDIKVELDDVVGTAVSCDMDSDGSICISELLNAGEVLEIQDAMMIVVASFNSDDSSPYCVNGLSAGDYQIRISAGEGLFACTEIIDVTIEEPDPMIVTNSVASPSDCIQEDGSITLTITGGTAAYSVTWSDPSIIGLMASGLSVGTYAYVVTDDNGCSAEGSVEVELPFCNEPCPEIVEEFAVVDAQCGESNGNMIVTVQGGGAYTYLWDTGASTQELLLYQILTVYTKLARKWMRSMALW